MANKFISPGVFTRETDLSFLPSQVAAIGGAVVGPTLYGPAFRPTSIGNYAEYLRAFGNTFVSGSGDVAKEYKYLTNYTANQYLNFGTNLTVVRILNSGATAAYSNVVSANSFNAAISAGSGSNDFTSSLFTAADASFTIHLMSEGVYGNTGTEVAATNGVGDPSTEDSLGLLADGYAERYNFRWEISNVNNRKGTFSLLLRRADDRTGRKVIMEQFNNLSLDPNDPGYIARSIGDLTYTLRDSGTGAPYIQPTGSYANRSRFIRVQPRKTTLNYLDVAGRVRVPSLSGSLPAPVSGTFAFGSDGYVQHPISFYNEISESNTQGFNLSSGAAGVSGSTAYYDAIDILSNADEYDINMLFLPGILDNAGGEHSEIITYAIAMCEERGDVFFVADPTKFGDTVTDAVNVASGRTSNFTAMYYPWIQIADPDLNRNVWLPPSCLISGVLTFSDSVSFPWYAPAGLNRGGIEIAQQAEIRLTASMRDSLYDAGINPIATFPREGVVVWGQKTLQKKRSALDRINVRRLLITAKKFIASSSRYLVFEQNTRETRARFLSIATPYFEDMQAKQGLYDFRVVMDERNNTPEVIDRNELRGAIYLKPTKTAEYVIIDFFVLPTGAVFPTDSTE